MSAPELQDPSMPMFRECQNGNANSPVHMHSTDEPKLRGRYRWSQKAHELVQSNIKATGAELRALICALIQESGNPRRACWRFVRRLGIRAKRPMRVWTGAEQHRLIKLLDLHPIPEIARLMRRSRSSVLHMLYRLGANANMGKDSFTKHTLAVALHVHTDTIESWIRRGWLKAREVPLGIGPCKRIIIEAEDFCEFCRKHTRDVIGNRLRRERLDFVYHFAFPPSHSELLPVRESKKERGAFEQQTRGLRHSREQITDCPEYPVDR